MYRKIALIAVLILIPAGAARAQSCNQASPPALCIDPLSWNVIGLDSNKAVQGDGPDTFMVGARACNKSATTLTNVVATYNTVGAVNPYINLADNSVISVPEIRPGRCEDFYFNGQITRINAAYTTSQLYTISAASGALTASTPSNRALYIERLNSQNRNIVSSVSGPTNVQVGGIYSYNVLWSTAPGGYEQLEHFVNLANTSFRLLTSYSTYDTPVGSSNTSIYADGCGWDNNVLSPTYRTCIGPTNYSGGKTGGNVNTFFTVQILGATALGGSRLRALIYDFSGSSYHYNTDFNDPFDPNDPSTGLMLVATAASDLGVTISDSPDPVVPGGTLTYSGTVTNAGLSALGTGDGGALKIPIPTDTTFSSISMPGWSCAFASGAVTCTPTSTFVSGASAAYTLNVIVNPTTAAGTQIPVTATISSTQEDPNPANNTAVASTLVVSSTQVDLAVTNTVPAVVVQGSTFAFTQTVTNSGPATATSPTFTTQVPAGTTFNSITTASTGWTCSAPVSGSITCTRSTPLAANESATFSLNLTASGAIGSTQTSTAWAQTATSEPFVQNNTATASTNIIGANTADVSITVSDFPDPVVAGESILYTQTVKNNGVIPAQNVTVSFPTPPNTVYTYIDYPAGWSCSTNPFPGTPTPGSAGTVTCTKATLAVGETASFPLTVTVNSATPNGTVINYTATVSTTTPDSIASNNTSSASTLVGSATDADVQIEKTVSANPARTGDALVYTLRVTNLGPATATNVTVTDPLPTNLSYNSAVTSRGTCTYNAATRTVSCAVGTLTVGQVAVVTVTTGVAAGASGSTLTNTATTAATQFDPRMSNNSSAAPTTILSATAVSMLRADAVQDGRTADLRWSTSRERDNLGFNVYRDSGSSRVKINRSLIAGSALVAGAEVKAGFTYRFVDRKPVAGGVYWLESIDLDGTRDLHGPIVPRADAAAAKFSAGVVAESMTLAELNTRAAAAQTTPMARNVETDAAQPANRDLAQQFELAGQPAAKIRIARDGFYRITRAQVAAAGFDPGSDPKSLSLYVDGQETPIAVNDGGDGRWDAGDTFEFYAIGMDSTYSGTRTYWLVGNHNGLRFRPKSRVKGPAGTRASFPYTAELKERYIFFAAQPNATDRDTFYGGVIYTDPVVQTFQLSNVAGGSGSVTLRVAVQGGTDVDHVIGVELNGTRIGALEFNGATAFAKTFTLPLSMIRSGANPVTLVAQAGPMDISFVDSLQLTYPHTYTADGDALRFPVTGAAQWTVKGFSNGDIRVVDVTDPRDPRELDATVRSEGGQFSLDVIPFDKGERVLYATTASAIAAPAGVTANVPSSLASRQNGADFVIVTHPEYVDAVAPLAALRNRQGVQTMVVSVDDVFDEFGFGSKSPDAIRDFLQYAQTQWKKAPRWALLAGDASFDPRDYTGYGQFDLVPTRFLPTVYMKAASDDWLADFDGDQIPNIFLGRLPARSAEEMRVMIDKIVRFTPPASPRTLMVVDTDDHTFSFRDAATAVKTTVPSNWTADDFAVRSSADRTALLSAIRSNPSVVNYIGHGGIDSWSNTSVLSSYDMDALRGSGSTPFFLNMSCLTGMFAEPDVNSLAEALLRTENGGAVAVWASSAMADPPPQIAANRELYRLLAANSSITLGELVARTKAAVPDLDLRVTWNLLGDPTLKLQN